MQLFHFGKHKGTVSLTITGVILAWIIGIIFMPKSCTKKDKIKIEGVWYSTTDSGFTRMEIKAIGYFYYEDVPKKGKSIQYKGMIDEEKEKRDTVLLVSFNADTLLYAKIETINKNSLVVKRINNNLITIFKKQ